MNFDNDSYDTPENIPKLLGDKLSMGTSFYFYYRFTYLMYHTNRVIKKGRFSTEEWIKSSQYNIKTLEGCGAKLHIRGLDNIRKTKVPVVFIGNHMSTLETFTLPALVCPIKPSSFIVKQGLIDSPFFGRIMRATLPIAVTRTDPVKDYKAVINDGKRLLESGRSVIVFPQSTRGPFISEEFGSIGIKLAKKAGFPIIPFALKTDFWGNGQRIKAVGPVSREKGVYFEFGKPMPIIEGTGKKEHQQIIDFIQQKLNEWEPGSRC